MRDNNQICSINLKNHPTIVSGGQTSADRAALDWAIDRGIPHGGWCPLGRKAEDGTIEIKYQLQETPSEEYAQRTEWNVRDSDATVIFSISNNLTGGSLLTKNFAILYCKPWLHLARDFVREESIDRDSKIALQADRLNEFLRQNQINILNIAGSRISVEPEIYSFVLAVLAVYSKSI